MWKRLPAPSRRTAVWLVNEDVEEQLDNLGTTNAGFFLPAGWNGSPFPMLKGRPVIACEQSAPVGTTGDIILADLSHYIIVDGGTTPMISAHVQFTSDQVVWRFVLRVDGRSAFTSAITPYKGSTTRSPFVTLTAR
jgi:HK97 family phage major capsid protein